VGRPLNGPPKFKDGEENIQERRVRGFGGIRRGCRHGRLITKHVLLLKIKKEGDRKTKKKEKTWASAGPTGCVCGHFQEGLHDTVGTGLQKEKTKDFRKSKGEGGGEGRVGVLTKVKRKMGEKKVVAAF